MWTALQNTLILLRIFGLRLAHEAGWDGFGPLIGVLSRSSLLEPSRN
jgi:hypothetical protein